MFWLLHSEICCKTIASHTINIPGPNFLSSQTHRRIWADEFWNLIYKSINILWRSTVNREARVVFTNLSQMISYLTIPTKYVLSSTLYSSVLPYLHRCYGLPIKDVKSCKIYFPKSLPFNYHDVCLTVVLRIRIKQTKKLIGV